MLQNSLKPFHNLQDTEERIIGLVGYLGNFRGICQKNPRNSPNNRNRNSKHQNHQGSLWLIIKTGKKLGILSGNEKLNSAFISSATPTKSSRLQVQAIQNYPTIPKHNTLVAKNVSSKLIWLCESQFKHVCLHYHVSSNICLFNLLQHCLKRQYVCYIYM